MTDDTDKACTTCGEGKLRHRVDRRPFEYKGQTTELDRHYSVCDACGFQPSNPDLMSLNGKNVTLFHKRVDGLMSGVEIRAIRKKLGLGKKEASRVFEGGSTPFQKYEKDRRVHSPFMDRLLRHAAECPETFMQTRDKLVAHLREEGISDGTDKSCSACGEGMLHPRVDKEPVEYEGQTTELDVHYSVCDACGSELANGEQINLNAKNMVIFCKQVDGHLSGSEIRAIRKKLGLGKKEASRVFEGGPIPFRKYEKDEKEHSPLTERLLRQAAKHPDAFMQTRDKLVVRSPESEMADDACKTCPACGEDKLRYRIDKEPLEHRGQTIDTDFHYYLCDVCGCELGACEQININEKRLMVFYKKVVGFLSGAEIRAIREKLGLSEKEASRVFKSGSTPFSEYENDQESQGPFVESLLRQADAYPEAFLQARAKLVAHPYERGMTDGVYETCSVCGKDKLCMVVDCPDVEYRGQTKNIDFHLHRCMACRSRLLTDEQRYLNAKLLTCFHKEVDGLLSGVEVRAIRERLGLSEEEASRAFKGGPTPFSKFENDDEIQSAETDRLLRQAAKHPDAFMQARDKVIVPPPGGRVRPKESASPAPMPG